MQLPIFLSLASSAGGRSRYKGVGTDKSKVAQFKNNEADTGSPEVQIAQLSARVLQLTTHLQEHRKDYSSTRGLTKVLSHRRALMKYLQKHNRCERQQCHFGVDLSRGQCHYGNWLVSWMGFP